MIISLIKEYIWKYKALIMTFILSSLLTWGISILMPYITGYLIDILITVKNKNILFKFSIIIIVLNVLNMFLQYILDYVSTKLNGNIVFNLSYKIYIHLKKVPLQFYEKYESSYLSTRINDDCNNVVDFFMGNCVNIITNMLTIIFSLYIIYRIDIILAIVFIATLPLYIIIYSVFRTKLFKSNYIMMEKRNNYFSLMTEQFRIIKHIKINSLDEIVNNKLKVSFIEVFKTVLSNFKINYLFNNLTALLIILVNIFIIFYGGMKVLEGRITVGNFIIINTYFNLILSSFSYFMEFGQSYQQALVSVYRINDLLHTCIEDNGKIKLDKINNIVINNLNFSFSDKDRLISNFSYTFKEGNIYCIRGNNGAGKSTFLNIVTYIYHDYDGDILYNTINIRDIDMYYLRSTKIAYADQNSTLISGTIYDNLTLGIRENDELKDKVIYWCKMFDIYDTIINLPGGFDVDISSEYVTISGGEKLKISIIRAFLKNTDILILDEPSSAFDKKSTEVLKSCLNSLKYNKIIILISHDDNLVNITDKYIYLE